jgi:hypothetical protein
MNSENVKIPMSVLNEVVDILQTLYTHSEEFNLAPDFTSNIASIFTVLFRKRQALELRVAYSKILAAKTETARNNARIDYLRLNHEFDDIPF